MYNKLIFTNIKCHYSCLTCNGSTLSNCLSCDLTGTNRVDNIGLSNSCPCDVGFFDNGNAICVACKKISLYFVKYNIIIWIKIKK